MKLKKVVKMISADIKAHLKQQGKKRTFYKKYLSVVLKVQCKTGM